MVPQRDFSRTIRGVIPHFFSHFLRRRYPSGSMPGLSGSAPHLHLPSPSGQTSINGARWGDNEAARRELGEVGEWRRHTGSSLSRRNERRRERRPRPQLTLEKPNLYVLHKGITCPGGVFNKKKRKLVEPVRPQTHTHHRSRKVRVQR